MKPTFDLTKYTKHGKFKLSSGNFSNTLYDVKEMICDGNMEEICKHIPYYHVDTVVGIETAGAIIATYRVGDSGLKGLAFYTKDDTIAGDIYGEYSLIDDVVTTENTIRKAIKKIGREPKSIFCVVDRRTNPILKIESMFKVDLTE